MNRKARRAQDKTARAAETVQSASQDASLDALLKKAHAYYLSKAYDEAYQACIALLNRYPYQPDTLTLLGLISSDKGELAQAEAFFKESLSRAPDNAQTLWCYGHALDRHGRLEEAIRFYSQALALKPNNLPTRHQLVLALQKTGQYLEALAQARKMLAQAPEANECWRIYMAMLGKVYPLMQPVLLEEDIALFPLVIRCMHQSQSNCVAVAGLELVLYSPAFSHLYDVAARNYGTELEQAINSGVLTQALGTPLMETLLKQHILPNNRMEYALTVVRRTILCLTYAHKLSEEMMSAHLPLMSALAQQCYLNEYAYNETSIETTIIETLTQSLEGTPHGSRLSLQACWTLLIYACYRPVKMLQNAEWIADSVQKDAIGSLKEIVEKTIIAPCLELRLKNEIPTLSGNGDETSQQVQSMYEANPYPRWHLLEKRNHWTLRDSIHADLPSLPEAKLPAVQDAPEVLIAGCGTGRQAIWASYYIGAKVLAIDLSLSSLAYALHKTRELGIGNIRYMKADILNLAQLDRKFDVIECTGVLHHMQDPMAGWRVLANLLAPGGMMRIALYSTRGRQAVIAAREWIASKGYSPTPEDIRACRRDILNGALGKWTEAVLGFADFYTISECRDLLFHVIEHTYTLPQIGEMLDTLGLEFLGLKPGGGQHYTRIYEEMFPHDTAKMSIARWDELEQKFPTAFAGMYEFWVKKA